MSTNEPIKIEKNEPNNPPENNNSENQNLSKEETKNTKKTSSIPIYFQLYPPFDLFDDKKKKSSTNTKGNLSNRHRLTDKNIVYQEEKNELAFDFLEELTKKPCPISKNKILTTISKNIQSSLLVQKLLKEYQSEKKISAVGICNLYTQYLFYDLLEENKILHRIGDMDQKLYYILSGRIQLLKLQEIYVKMSYEEYVKYCIFLLNKNENYILNEVMSANNKILPFKSSEEIQTVYLVYFCNLLSLKIKKHIIKDNFLLKRFFQQSDMDYETFGIKTNELDYYQQKIIKRMKGGEGEWASYVLEKCTPSETDKKIYDFYKNYLKIKKEKNIKCYIYVNESYLEPGNFFGEISDTSLVKECKFTARAQKNSVLAWIKNNDYLNIISPKRKLEKMKEVAFIHNNFFFNELNSHVFEKYFFDLFLLHEYTRDTVIYKVGDQPKHLLLLKEGRLSLEINCSVIDLQNLIKKLFESLIKNPLIEKLPLNKKRIILSKEKIELLKNYIQEPIFKHLKTHSKNVIDELNKIKNFQIAVLTGIETVALEEIFLGCNLFMNCKVMDNKVQCYELQSDQIHLFYQEEKDVLFDYIRAATNKIISTIQRLACIKKNCIKFTKMKDDWEIQKQNTIEIENKKLNLPNINNLINNNKINHKIKYKINNINSFTNSNVNILSSEDEGKNEENNYNNNSIYDSVTMNINNTSMSFFGDKSPIKHSINDNRQLIELIKCLKSKKKGKNINNSKNSSKNILSSSSTLLKILEKNKNTVKSKKSISYFRTNYNSNKFNAKTPMREKILPNYGGRNFYQEPKNNLPNQNNTTLVSEQNIDSLRNKKLDFNTIRNYYLQDENNINNFSNNNLHKKFPLNLSLSVQKAAKSNELYSRSDNPFTIYTQTSSNTYISTTENNLNKSKNFLKVLNEEQMSSSRYTRNNIGTESTRNLKFSILSDSSKKKLKIPDVIKDYYNEIKMKGFLSFLPKKEANTYFMRKFHQKYRSVGVFIRNNTDNKCNNQKV